MSSGSIAGVAAGPILPIWNPKARVSPQATGRSTLELVAPDLHIGALHTQLAPGLAQHGLAKAVVLTDQVAPQQTRSQFVFVERLPK
ncbi:hypothetical protein EUB48_08080 [Rhodoferax sediminis]|uniref:Uncharacterized protein n=2 Tax=Rhodoferax sediminis TaxID=2509614 RepID=A0A515DA10_9BURK|nr:hypothetical protein EUB48_08080 [Rhodoferax sediminis]